MFGLFESKEQKREKLIANGMRAMTAGRFNESEGFFLKAIELDIFNASDAWIGLGALYLGTEYYKKAKDCFNTAIGQKKNDFHALRGLALAERKLGNDNAAVDLFRQLKCQFDYRHCEDSALTGADHDWLSENGL